LNNNINNNFNFINVDRIEPFYNYYYRRNKINLNYFIELFFKDFNVKFLYKINHSNDLFYSINKFFDFNLMNFNNFKNRFDSYKDVMAIKSVYQYRFANSSFKTMDEFMLTIFKTPLENYLYFNEAYKNYSYDIIFNIFIELEKIFFFKDLFNNNNNRYKKSYSNIYKYFNKLFKIYIYFLKFNPFIDLINDEINENLLKIDVFSRFFYKFKKNRLFYRIHKVKKRRFYRNK
jgi:hypothetical protein